MGKVFNPQNLTLDKIQDKKNKARHLRSMKSKPPKLIQKLHLRVWSPGDLTTAKGTASGIPLRKLGIRLTGKEPDPGPMIKKYIAQQLKAYRSGKLGGHIAGTPVAVCQMAYEAQMSGQTDWVSYVIDQLTGRSEFSTGRVVGRHPKRDKGSLPKFLGGAKPGDHKGHGIPEGGVENPDLVNVLPNIVPQEGTTNVSHKKVFENQVIDYADTHPSETVHTVHERFYPGPTDLRPEGETHYMVVDGAVIAAVTIENPS
jgi:hypothetical protein